MRHIGRRAVAHSFDLDADYYEKSGGLFMPSEHYEEMFA